MKKFLLFTSIFAFLVIPTNSALAWNVSYLNPLPYIGIGCNQTKFSLNPFKGFKNCEPCKKIEKCNRCAMIERTHCTSCQRTFTNEIPKCNCGRN